jgi:hypothetical protein
MYKKTLLSLAVASSITLTGCIGTESGDGDSAGNNPNAAGLTWPIFNPAAGALPIPSDLNFDQDAADGSFGVDGDMTNPVIAALNNLSGASTVAPAVIRLNGQIDEESVDSRAVVLANPEGPVVAANIIPNPNQNVFLIELEYASGEPVRGLSTSEPPTIPLAITVQVANGLNPLGIGTDLEGRDLTAAGQYLVELYESPGYDHDVVELDGTSAIRIRPLKPLSSLTRYVAVVTDGVMEVDGQTPIVQSPTYKFLTETTSDDPLVFKNRVPTALAPVGTILNSLWETIGTSYFGLTNQARAAFQLPALDKENIAISYSFTTGEDTKVLSHMGNPANWIADQLRRSITVPAAAGAANFGAAFGAVQTALGTFQPSVELDNAALAPCDGAAPYTTPFGSFSDQFVCVGTLVKGAVGVPGTLDDTLNTLGLSFPQPKARAIEITSTEDALDVSSVLSQLTGLAAVDVHQGNISLPQYVAVPDETQTGETSTIRTKSWRPDATLATVLGSPDALDTTIPQQDPQVSTVLNYNFPFPKEEGEVQVPMLVITPDGADPRVDPTPADTTDNLVPVIFQHGITTDRSAALAFGTQLVAAAQAQGVRLAVFAIDQPLHGISPFTAKEQEVLALTLLAAGGIVPEPTEEDVNGDPVPPEGSQDTIDAVIAGSLKFGVVLQIQAQLDAASPGTAPNLGITDTNDISQLQAAITMVLNGDAGADAQATMENTITLERTVANAGSTIPGLAPVSTATGAVAGVNERHYGFTAGPGNNPIAMDFDAGIGSSGSLFINLTNFMNSRDVLRQGSMDLMNLTATLNTSEDLPGLTNDSGVFFIGHSLGSLNGGAFVGATTRSGNPNLLVSATHLLTPVAGVTRLLENSPSFAPTILGGLQAAAGLTQGDADLETFLNVNQAMLDAVDPINFAGELAVSNVLLGQIEGDRTTPNAADTRFGADKGPLEITFPNGLMVDSFVAPLSGSEALAAMMGATGFTPADPIGSGPAITRYPEGVHSTPVLPRAEIAEAPDANGFTVLKNRTIATGDEVVVSAGDAQAAFGAMIQQSIDLFTP